MISVDLDEFIAPSNGKTLVNLTDSGRRDCIVIRTSFALQPQDSNALFSESISTREELIFEGVRQKYVCRGTSIGIAGIHYPFDETAKVVKITSKAFTINPEEAIVFHARENVEGKTVQDNRILQVGQHALPEIRHIINDLVI